MKRSMFSEEKIIGILKEVKTGALVVEVSSVSRRCTGGRPKCQGTRSFTKLVDVIFC